MNKAAQPNKQMVLLVVILLLTYLIAYTVLFFIPRLETIRAKTAFNEQRAKYLAQMERDYREYAGLKKQAAELAVEVRELDQKMPQEMGKPEMMMTVYNTAKKFGVSPISLDFESKQEEGPYGTIAMRFSCRGPYDKVMALIGEFQKGPEYYFALESISFDREGDEQQANQIRADMKIVSYFYQQAQSQ